jgi:hypothetical protein
MHFEVRKCPQCQGYLKLPANRSSVLCMYCGAPIAVPPTKTSQRSLFIRRSIGVIFLALLIVMTVLLLISFRIAHLGFRRLLGLLGTHAQRVMWQRPDHISDH